MVHKVNSPVSVGVSFDHTKGKALPRWVFWEGRLHGISKIGLHHTYREGRTLFHIFSVTTKTLFLRLRLNTENLLWRLEETDDGLPS